LVSLDPETFEFEAPSVYPILREPGRGIEDESTSVIEGQAPPDGVLKELVA
jgi:hypothetical protein